jgi:hypothetical protein
VFVNQVKEKRRLLAQLGIADGLVVVHKVAHKERVELLGIDAGARRVNHRVLDAQRSANLQP